MRRRTFIGLCALALAALTLGGCKSTAVAETKEIQTQRTKDLVIALLNEKGELVMGQNRFIKQQPANRCRDGHRWFLDGDAGHGADDRADRT